MKASEAEGLVRAKASVCEGEQDVWRLVHSLQWKEGEEEQGKKSQGERQGLG